MGVQRGSNFLPSNEAYLDTSQLVSVYCSSERTLHFCPFCFGDLLWKFRRHQYGVLDIRLAFFSHTPFVVRSGALVCMCRTASCTFTGSTSAAVCFIVLCTFSKMLVIACSEFACCDVVAMVKRAA